MLIETPTFTVGAILVVIIGVGFVLNLTERWRKIENAINKPMSITLTTAKSPAELLLDARIAKTKRRFTFFVIAIGIWVFLRLRYPEVAYSLESLLGNIVVTLMQGVAELLLYFVEILT